MGSRRVFSAPLAGASSAVAETVGPSPTEHVAEAEVAVPKAEVAGTNVVSEPAPASKIPFLDPRGYRPAFVAEAGTMLERAQRASPEECQRALAYLLSQQEQGRRALRATVSATRRERFILQASGPGTTQYALLE